MLELTVLTIDRLETGSLSTAPCPNASREVLEAERRFSLRTSIVKSVLLPQHANRNQGTEA